MNTNHDHGWPKLYRAAVIELDPERRQELIDKAVEAIQSREYKLRGREMRKARELTLLSEARRILGTLRD
jgi:hypothetical protein